MEALGRVFNAVAVADNVYVNLKDTGGVSFLCYLAGAVGDVYTLTEAKTAAGGSAQVLATIERFWTSDGVGGVWTLRTNVSPLSTATTSNTTAQNGMVVEVDPIELSATYSYVKLASTGAGLVTAITRDLHVQRKPSNLPSVIV